MAINSPISKESITPDTIFKMLHGFWITGILKAGIELEIFTKIAYGHKTIDKIAEALESSRRGIRILLNALCAIGLLTKSRDIYSLTPTADKFLVKNKETYIGSFSSAIPLAHWEAFGRMAEAVKSGKPIVDFISCESKEWEEVALSLIPLALPVADALCDIIGIGRGDKTGLKILDVACGSGIYGYTLLKHDPKSSVTGIDRQNVLRVAENVAQKMGVADRVVHRPGDILAMTYGHNEFDIAIVSHILQGFGPEKGRRILEKVYKALISGGMVVINDFVADEERSIAKYPLLFACYMLIVTEDGDTYTFSEFKSWLDEVGFIDVTKHDISGESTLITAIKG